MKIVHENNGALVAHASRVSGFGVSPKRSPLKRMRVDCAARMDENFAIAGRNRQTRRPRVLPGETVISCAGDCGKKFFAASEKVPILRLSASVA